VKAPEKGRQRPWIIYTRVSTEEQAESGHSLPAQEKACRAMCEARQYPFGQVLSDPGQSAKNLNRPQVQRLIELVREGKVGGIIVWKLDRLTRNLRDLLALVDLLEESGTALVSVSEQIATDTPAGRMMLSILGSVAQWERETIAERIKLGIRQRIQDGGWIGGPAPAGCVVVGEKGKKRLEVDLATAAIVTPIWSMVANGKTINDIAVYLTESGVKPPRKMGWRPATVHSLLSQDRLIGLLVDEASFNACHEALKSRSCPARPKGGVRLSGQGRSERVWPLANLARCAHCGATLFGCSARGRHGELHPYLRCTKKTKKLCSAPDLPAGAWEAAVCKAVQLVLADQGPYAERLNAIAIELQRRANNRHEDTAVLVKERDGVQARMQRLIALAEAGDAPIKGIADRLKELKRELAEADLKVAEMEGLSSASNIDADGIADLLEQFRAGAVGLEDRPPEDQKRVLSGLLAGVRIGHGKPIELSMLMPDLVALGGSIVTPGANEPTPTEGVSLGRRGFASASSLVEAPGIEPGSGTVRAALLRA